MIYAVDVLRGEQRSLKRRLEEKKVMYEATAERRSREDKEMVRLVGVMNDLSQDLAEIENAITALGAS